MIGKSSLLCEELERTGKCYVWASYLVISFILVVFKRLKGLEGNLVYEVSNRIVLILVLVIIRILLKMSYA
jgi:hypothetical protein